MCQFIRHISFNYKFFIPNIFYTVVVVVVVVLLFYVHGNYLRSCWDGQLT